MLIECTLKRVEPIVVPIGNEKYHFELDAKGRNVAEVWIESHVEAFLAVSHLYRQVKDEPAADPAAELEPAQKGGDGTPLPTERKDVIAALKERGVKFAVTETTEALRAKLLAVSMFGG